MFAHLSLAIKLVLVAGLSWASEGASGFGVSRRAVKLVSLAASLSMSSRGPEVGFPRSSDEAARGWMSGQSDVLVLLMEDRCWFQSPSGGRW